jgi:hypothetical protein
MSNVHDFVVSKAKNMMTMLEPFIKTESHKKLVSQYGTNDIETLTHKYLAPLFATGTLSIARDNIVSELDIKDEEVIKKLDRYLLCFCESLLVK